MAPPIDYSKGCIYTLVCDDNTISDFYVGSTTDTTSREQTHKTACNDERNKLRVYEFIRENGGWENWKFTVQLKRLKNTRMNLINFTNLK